ncbi:MAG: Flp family type IVb pilin [Candidatus Dormibacteria bacterium]
MTAPAATKPAVDPDPSTSPDPLEGAPAGRSGERGQGMVEYAFILILIAMAVLIALQVLGHTTNDLFTNVSNALTTAGGH